MDGSPVDDGGAESLSDQSAAPRALGRLPDGREALILGNPEGLRAIAHLQGDNSYGFEGTCGLVSCQAALYQLGIDVTEDDLVRYAVEHRLCNVAHDPTLSGGTTAEGLVRLLAAYGVLAHNEMSGTLDQLAAIVEKNKPCIIGVNAGVLWDSPDDFGNGEANHAVAVTGTARDLPNGQILGFYINDSGVPDGGARFVEVETMMGCWVDTGRQSVVVDTLQRQR